MRKAIRYIRSFFYDPKNEISNKYIEDFIDLQGHLFAVKENTDPYEAALVLIGSTQNKIELINKIKGCYEKVNYGQYDKTIKHLNIISSQLEIMDKNSWIAISKLNGQVKPIPFDASKTYIRLENKFGPMSLHVLKHQDEKFKQGDTYFEENSSKVQKFVDDNLSVIFSSLNAVI